MKKMLVFLFAGLFVSFNLFAQNGQGQGQHKTPGERAQMTLDELVKTVPFTAKQKTDMLVILTKFYNDAHDQHAFRDPEILAPLEKERDGKVEKMLNNKTTYKKYQDSMAAMKKKFEQQRQQGGPPKN